ncbi:MAG: S46 family peptidase [Bacteroidales bacterium]|nr:S46 family peptidase [Bacteroidales bacterium]
MKKTCLLLILFFTTICNLKADEGMWILSLIGKNYNQMKALGFKLTPEDLYNLNQPSLKDAVVALNHGECTAEFVSNQGLLFTNHHCGYDDIQSQSSVYHDYLTNGFCAKNLKEELPIYGKTVSLLESITDVTEKIIPQNADKMSALERQQQIENNIEELSSTYEEQGYYVTIDNFFNGNYYYLSKYKVYKDVRLVFAPPEAIGNFGGETDNWVWPRHSVDFCMFRVYCAPDGSPADYSENNIPFTPKKYLTINASGVKEGDFSMIIGFPGETYRHNSVAEINQTINCDNKCCIEALDLVLKQMKNFMDKNDTIRIQYASKYATLYNTYKYSVGCNKCFETKNIIENKTQLENELTKWINDNNKTEYKNIVNSLKKDYKKDYKNNFYYCNWVYSLYMGCEFIEFGHSLYDYYYNLLLNNQTEIDKSIQKLKTKYHNYFNNYNKKVDYEISSKMLNYYFNKVPKKYWPKGISNVPEFYDDLKTRINNSILTDEKSFNNILEHPSYIAFQQDKLFDLSKEILYATTKMYNSDKFDANFEYHKYLYTKAKQEMLLSKNPDTLLYYDANSTMRLTYGKVCGYKYNNKDMGWYTTFDSFINKKNNNDKEFYVSEKLENLYLSKDYGQYSEPDGTIRVCYLTDNDITGGNSGSGCLNANGQLVGLAFDGNWEAMSSDYMFEPEITRTICVDIRFILFIIDKYSKADNILNELTIVWN